MSPSSQVAPSCPGAKPHPLVGSQVSTSQAEAGAGQVRVAPPPHVPTMQVSSMAHLFPDAHGVPFAASDTTQPLAGTHAAAWQGLVGWPHWSAAPPPQVPAVQVVPAVQALPSSHGVPSATLATPQVPSAALHAPTLQGLAGVGPGQVTPAHKLPPPAPPVPAGIVGPYIVVSVFEALVLTLLPALYVTVPLFW